MILLKHIPHDISSAKDKKLAKKYLLLLREYDKILLKLITAHKNTVYLKRLHATHQSKISDWSEQVTKTLKKFDQLLLILKEDLAKLEHCLENNPDEWQDKLSDLSMGMVMTGLHNETEEINRLRNIAIFNIKELEILIDNERHDIGLRAWQKLSKLKHDEKLLAYQIYFRRLLDDN